MNAPLLNYVVSATATIRRKIIRHDYPAQNMARLSGAK